MFEDKVIKPLLQDINAKDIALLSKNAIVRSEDNIFQYLIMHINAEIYHGAIFNLQNNILYGIDSDVFENKELESKIINRICEYYKERNFEVSKSISYEHFYYITHIYISWLHIIKDLKENEYESDSNKDEDNIEITFDIIAALYDKRFNKFDPGISYRRSSLPGNYIIEECTGNSNKPTGADKSVKFKKVGNKWEIEYNNPRMADNTTHGICRDIVNNILEVFSNIDEFFNIERTIDAEYINNIKKDIMEGNE